MGQKVEQEARVLENASQAVEKALEFTGFKMSKDYSLPQVAEDIAKLDVTELLSFPFLADQMNGKEVWRIEFDSVLLKHEKAKKSMDAEYYRDFVVAIDAASGHLIEIRSIAKGFGDSVVELTISAYEKQCWGAEEHLGFPEDPPSVKFYDVLCSLGYSPHVGFIVGRYIKYMSHYRNEAGQLLPVWTVDFYNVPPRGYSNSRSLVNAETGKCWKSISIVDDAAFIRPEPHFFKSSDVPDKSDSTDR